jgi:hypothetical protein
MTPKGESVTVVTTGAVVEVATTGAIVFGVSTGVETGTNSAILGLWVGKVVQWLGLLVGKVVQLGFFVGK